MTPARILVTTNAAVGHFLPMTATITALAAAGHDVFVGCPRSFAPFVERCGFVALPCREVDVDVALPPVPAPEDHDGRLDWAVTHGWPWDCRAWVDDLVAAARAWRPDLVLVEPVEHAGRIAAAVLGVPYAVHGWGFSLPAALDSAAAGTLADLYRRFAAEPSDACLLADLGPQYLQPPDAPRVPRFAYVPWSSPGAALPPRSKRARVLVTLGTYPDPGAAARLRAVALAAGRPQVEVVVVLGGPDRVPDAGFPSDVTVVEWTDVPRAIRDSDLVVHHGGAGTSWATVAAGRPAVVVPHGADQFTNAACLRTAGVAEVVDEPADVSAAVERALASTAMRTAAARASAANARLPGPGDLAAELVRLVR